MPPANPIQSDALIASPLAIEIGMAMTMKVPQNERQGYQPKRAKSGEIGVFHSGGLSVTLPMLVPTVVGT
jgi:hypothetical protein